LCIVSPPKRVVHDPFATARGSDTALRFLTYNSILRFLSRDVMLVNAR